MSKLSFENERISANDVPKENPYKISRTPVRNEVPSWVEEARLDDHQSGDHS